MFSQIVNGFTKLALNLDLFKHPTEMIPHFTICIHLMIMSIIVLIYLEISKLIDLVNHNLQYHETNSKKTILYKHINMYYLLNFSKNWSEHIIKST